MPQDWNTDFDLEFLTKNLKKINTINSQVSTASGAKSGKTTGPKPADQGAGHGKKLSGGGRFLYKIPGAWADRVGGTRGVGQSLNIEAENQGEAVKQLIRRGIPATIVKGFDVSKTKSTAPATNLFEDLPIPKTNPVNAVTAGGVLNPEDFAWDEPGFKGRARNANPDFLNRFVSTEGGTSADDKLQAATMSQGSIDLIKELEKAGQLSQPDFAAEIAGADQITGLGTGDLNAAAQDKRRQQLEIDEIAKEKTWKNEDNEGGDIDKDGWIGDPRNKNKAEVKTLFEDVDPTVSSSQNQTTQSDDPEVKAAAENTIANITGVNGITSNISSDQASALASMLGGELGMGDMISILEDSDFKVLFDDPSTEFFKAFGPVVNPLLRLAIDTATKREAAEQGIELENIKGGFLLDQSEIQALGGLSKFQAGKIRGDAAVSGASGFGAMLAADTAPQRADIKDLAAMQASGGFTTVEDMLKAQGLAASGGLAQEDVLGQRQAEAATNPWAAMQLAGVNTDMRNINTALRGGLSPTQQKDLAAAPAYAAGNPYDMTAQQNIDLQNQQARGGLQEAQKLTPFELALEGQRQRGGLGIEQYMESLRGGLSPEERLAEIRNTGYYNATRPAELQAAASGPYGYMQQQLGMGLNEQQRANVLGEVGQMQRGGLSVQERLAEIQAQGAPQQLSSYLNFIGNPAAVAAAQQGGFSPFGDFAQRTADAPAGTVPQEFAGLGNIGVGAPASPGFTTPPEFTGLSGTSDYAGGLEQDATMADWDKLSGNQGQAALGEWAMQGTAPDEAERKMKSATPMSSNEYGRSPQGEYAVGRGY